MGTGKRVRMTVATVACLAGAAWTGAGEGEDGAVETLRLTGTETLGTEHCEALSPREAVTLEAWLRPEGARTDIGPIIRKAAAKGEGDEAAYVLELFPGNRLRMVAGGVEARSAGRLPTGRLSHVAGVFGFHEGICRLYVDGREVGRSARPPASKLGRSTGPLLIGAAGRDGLRDGFRGEMARVTIYDRALQPDEIARLAAEPERRSLDLAGTVGEWDFREGDARFLALGSKKRPKARKGPSRAAREAGLPFDPTEHYERRRIEGWRVLVNKDFARKQPALCERTMKLIGSQLLLVTRNVPAPAVAKLRKVTIWSEAAETHHACATYHPNPGWLRAHDMNPDKGRCVELSNARNFLSWTRHQPWMVMHELAHAYQHQFLEGGYGSRELRAEFERAMKEKLYESVLKHNGRNGKAYATSNPMEYFAENTEAFFGTNDFYPFVRPELKRHDPKMYELLKKLWGVK